MTIVVHVAGMTGVGKTFLCTRIGPTCHDLDDIARRHAGTGRAYVAELLRLTTHAATTPLVVLVGSFSVPKRVHVDHRIVLTVPARQRAATYRRMLLRNLDNVVAHRERIAAIVRAAPVGQIQRQLSGLAINTGLGYDFDSYVRWVDQAARDHGKHGYVPMTGPAAFRFIRALSP